MNSRDNQLLSVVKGLLKFYKTKILNTDFLVLRIMIIIIIPSFSTKKVIYHQNAGLLAYGSIPVLRLPISFEKKQWHIADPVPVYSGGTAPDLHRLPF